MKRFYLVGFIVIGLLFTGAGCLQFGTQAKGPMGMYQSSDKGEGWAQINNLVTPQGNSTISGANIYRMHTDPQDSNAMYLATRGQGLIYTYDNGKSWQSVPAMSGKFIYGFAVDPKNKCTLYSSDGSNIYKTVDCSRSWNLVYTEQRPDQRFVALAVDYGNTNLIYGTQLGGDLLVSNNGGTSWRVLKRFGYQLQNIIADPFAPGRLYVASYDRGLERSDDGGSNWKNLAGGMEGFADANKFYRLVINYGKKDSIFWISKYGILRSDNAGETWTDLKLITPPGSVNIYAFDINPKNQSEMYYTGTILGDKNAHVRSTFYKTTDGGQNWITKKMPTNTIPVGLIINPRNENILNMGFSTL